MRTLASDYEIVLTLKRIGSFFVATCVSFRRLANLKDYSPQEEEAFLEEYRQVSKANVGSVGFEDYPLWENRSEQTQKEIRKTKIVEFLRYTRTKLSINCS